MAKKNSTTTATEESGIKKFTISSGSTKQVALCKVAVPTIRIGDSAGDDAEAQVNSLLSDAEGCLVKLAGLIQQAVESGATHIRGTLTCYKK